jgi:hypothetical protein
MCQANHCQGTCARLGIKWPEGCRRSKARPLGITQPDQNTTPKVTPEETEIPTALPLVEITLGGSAEPLLKRCA